jgi:Ca-activated chloride channel homolog
MEATIRLEHDLVAVEGDHDVHALLELTVPEPATGASRTPLALVLVIDRSGSMGGEKLASATRSAVWLAGRLHADDRLAIVDYDDEVRLLVPLAPVGPQHTWALRAIRAGGQTNLSGGWLKGLEQLQGVEGARKILLLTDGLANVGISDTQTLVRLAAAARREGVGTTTIGFGDGFNEDLLTGMADAGGGNSHYAETADAAAAIFAEEFDDLTRLAAQNVSVEIRPEPTVELLGVPTSTRTFPSRAASRSRSGTPTRASADGSSSTCTSRRWPSSASPRSPSSCSATSRSANRLSSTS